MIATPMKTDSSDTGRWHLPSLHLSLEVTRGQFSDMLRMLEAGRLKEFRFALEDEAEGSWPIHSWGMSAAFDDASR
jgi:hypothetical protein